MTENWNLVNEIRGVREDIKDLGRSFGGDLSVALHKEGFRREEGDILRAQGVLIWLSALIVVGLIESIVLGLILWRVW